MERELVKNKAKPQTHDLLQSIGEIARTGHRLARQAEKQYALEVEDLLRNRCPDSERIEHLLDGMLDFGFDAAMVRLYKKLCRYYFEIDPRATVSYVHAYRDMWDEQGQAKDEERGVK